jgi:porphobilinogen synthase
MPGVKTFPLKGYDAISSEIQGNGVNNVLVFGVPAKKDGVGSGAYAKDGVVQKAIEGLKENSDMLVIADLCLCEYTDHGHCGVLDKCGNVINDETIELYGKTAVSQADAGADIIAPSGMMDGQIAAIRMALDDAGHKNVPIMAYSAKFYSAYYGPFRDVANSAPGQGNRAGYQMQCGNRKEAMREIEFDIAEGADMIMVKPAGPYLDIIRDAANTFDLPLAAYQVSGEYAMIKAAAQNGWIDYERVMMESLLGIKRAGADMIITYFAEEAARML